MKRFFVNSVSDINVLEGDIHTHLSFVTRARVGETVILCPSDGFDYINEIVKIEKTKTTLKLIQKVKNQSEPSIDVTLFFGALKGDKMDLVTQKATELGVNTLIPLITKFVQVKSESIKPMRLNKIIVEAAQQCGRSVLPKLDECQMITDIVPLLHGFDLVVFPYENEKERDLKSYLKSFEDSAIKKVAVIIGSEGGFDKSECELLMGNGVFPVSLGGRILRAETANISVLSAIMYEFGQWK